MFSYIGCIENKYGKESLNKEAAIFRRSAIKNVLTQRQKLQKNDVCIIDVDGYQLELFLRS